MKRKIRPPKDDYPPPWESGPVSRERWRKHSDRLMAAEHAGCRPEERWVYEKGMAHPHRKSEADALFEMDELSEAELAELMPRWREYYEKAWQPDFSYCIGRAKPDDTFAS